MGTTPTSYSAYAGVSLIVFLTACLVALKMTDQIDWSWWWVLAPVFLLAIFVAISIALGLVFVRDYIDRGDWP